MSKKCVYCNVIKHKYTVTVNGWEDGEQGEAAGMVREFVCS